MPRRPSTSSAPGPTSMETSQNHSHLACVRRSTPRSAKQPAATCSDSFPTMRSTTTALFTSTTTNSSSSTARQGHSLSWLQLTTDAPQSAPPALEEGIRTVPIPDSTISGLPGRPHADLPRASSTGAGLIDRRTSTASPPSRSGTASSSTSSSARCHRAPVGGPTEPSASTNTPASLKLLPSRTRGHGVDGDSKRCRRIPK